MTTLPTTPEFTHWREFPPLELPPILQSALQRFGQYGYHATTVRMIAGDVGVTVPALYYHFENKQAMLVTLLRYASQIISEHSNAALKTSGTHPAARLSAFVESLVLYMAHHSDLAFIHGELRSLTEENYRLYVAGRDELEQQLREILQEGVEHGIFLTPEPTECARAILAMCQAVASWYNIHGELTPHEVALNYAKLALATAEYVTEK